MRFRLRVSCGFLGGPDVRLIRGSQMPLWFHLDFSCMHPGCSSISQLLPSPICQPPRSPPIIPSLRSSVGDMENFRIWGLGRVWGAILTLHFPFWIAQKLRRTILLYAGLVTFRFHFLKIRKVLIFMIFGPSGRDHDPQKPLILTLDPPDDSKWFKKIPNRFKQILCSNILKYWKFKIPKQLKTRVLKIPEDPS